MVIESLLLYSTKDWLYLLHCVLMRCYTLSQGTYPIYMLSGYITKFSHLRGIHTYHLEQLVALPLTDEY